MLGLLNICFFSALIPVPSQHNLLLVLTFESLSDDFVLYWENSYYEKSVHATYTWKGSAFKLEAFHLDVFVSKVWTGEIL